MAVNPAPALFPTFDALQLFSLRPHIWVFTRPWTACPAAGEIRPGAVPDVEYGFVGLHSFQRGLLAGFVIAASSMLVRLLGMFPGVEVVWCMGATLPGARRKDVYGQGFSCMISAWARVKRRNY